jgi:programmed cell death protein 5
MVILSAEARSRLQNIKMVKKEFAESIEMQLIQLYQQGTLSQSFRLPISDGDFKIILEKIQSKNKRDTKIRIM